MYKRPLPTLAQLCDPAAEVVFRAEHYPPNFAGKPGDTWGQAYAWRFLRTSLPELHAWLVDDPRLHDLDLYVNADGVRRFDPNMSPLYFKAPGSLSRSYYVMFYAGSVHILQIYADAFHEDNSFDIGHRVVDTCVVRGALLALVDNRTKPDGGVDVHARRERFEDLRGQATRRRKLALLTP